MYFKGQVVVSYPSSFISQEPSSKVQKFTEMREPKFSSIFWTLSSNMIIYSKRNVSFCSQSASIINKLLLSDWPRPTFGVKRTLVHKLIFIIFSFSCLWFVSCIRFNVYIRPGKYTSYMGLHYERD